MFLSLSAIVDNKLNDTNLLSLPKMKLFEDDILEDHRTPLLSFGIPGIDGDFGLLAPRWEPWRQFLYIAILVLLIQSILGAFNYAFIVSKRGSISAYLVGWGFVIPFIAWLPFQLVEIFEIHNKMAKIIPANILIAVLFRTIEAMYGTSPPRVEDSLARYIEYYGQGARPKLDKKTNQPLQATLIQFMAPLLRIALYYHLLSLTTSIGMHFDWEVFPSPVKIERFHFNLDLLRPAHFANSYINIVHTYFYVRFAFEIVAIQEIFKGYVIEKPFKNPLLTSKSPSAFWGRHWNKVIHDNLKTGAYMPTRKFFPSWVAVMVAFFLSGFIHDYTWVLAFYHHQSTRDPVTGVCEDCYESTPGKLTLFFLWQAGVMTVERLVGKYPPFSWIGQNLPTPIVSTLVVMTSLPVSHWFFGDYCMGGTYPSISQSLWIVRKL
ncbi:Pfam:DUF821 [Seminavis robusta]|uniref:Pfam:DUF821 n=1 Tax=Seminavis robusta TaxID=568900 RepID=A0A9N8DD30_9STRA|nr:Pfam:DUF821 [Seminavis robusta]|eukprot:Sro20_g014120.1 Pfam:DUF821 (434) ;mRNA; f:85821-87330